jgi:hypothetical protein
MRLLKKTPCHYQAHNLNGRDSHINAAHLTHKETGPESQNTNAIKANNPKTGTESATTTAARYLKPSRKRITSGPTCQSGLLSSNGNVLLLRLAQCRTAPREALLVGQPVVVIVGVASARASQERPKTIPRQAIAAVESASH